MGVGGWYFECHLIDIHKTAICFRDFNQMWLDIFGYALDQSDYRIPKSPVYSEWCYGWNWFKNWFSQLIQTYIFKHIYLSIYIYIYLSIYLYTYTYIYIYIYCLQFLFILMQNIQDNLWRSTKFTVSWKTDQVLRRKMLNWRTKRVKEIGPSVYEDPIYNEKWTIYLFWIYCWFI